MYETYFGLEKAPFSLSPDPRFLYAAPRTREAFAGVLHGVLDRRGFVVLTGESGTGKSTLLRAVLTEISPERLASSLIFNPVVKPEEFLELAMLDFGLSNIPESKPRRLAYFNDFLIENHNKGRINVLFVDEAHTLTPALLEEIRLLTNFESSDTKLLQIVLSGHTELDDMLERFELRQLKQRIAIRATLRPLQSVNEVGSYILHRWRKAGAKGDLPFHPGAIAAIAHFSQGIPRTINSLCDSCLMLAYGSNKRFIDRGMVIEIALEMRLVPQQQLPQQPVAALNGSPAYPMHPPRQLSAPAPAAAPAAPTPSQQAVIDASGVPQSPKPAPHILDEELFADDPSGSAHPVPVEKVVSLPVLSKSEPGGAATSSSSSADSLKESDQPSETTGGGGIGQWASRFRKAASFRKS
jgi:general secretion pathway protein A